MRKIAIASFFKSGGLEALSNMHEKVGVIVWRRVKSHMYEKRGVFVERRVKYHMDEKSRDICVEDG